VLVAYREIRIAVLVLVGVRRNTEIIESKRGSIARVTVDRELVRALHLEGTFIQIDQTEHERLVVVDVLVIRVPSSLCVSTKNVSIGHFHNSQRVFYAVA